MKKFFSFVIKQSVAVILIVLLVLGFGVYSTINMSVNLLPDINVPIVCVQVIYPGANADSVEKDVTVKVEEGVGSVSGITSVSSSSYDNLSAVILSFDYGTDTKAKKEDISAKLSAISLPDGVNTKIYDLDLNASALASVSVTSENGLEDAYAKAKELSSRFSAIDGVENVSIKGGADYSYTVIPYTGLELACPLIVKAFSYGALDIPLGNITDNGSDVQIRNNSDVKSEEDILNTPVELPEELRAVLGEYRSLLQNVNLGEYPYSDATLAMIETITGIKVSNDRHAYSRLFFVRIFFGRQSLALRRRRNRGVQIKRRELLRCSRRGKESLFSDFVGRGIHGVYTAFGRSVRIYFRQYFQRAYQYADRRCSCRTYHFPVSQKGKNVARHCDNYAPFRTFRADLSQPYGHHAEYGFARRTCGRYRYACR